MKQYGFITTTNIIFSLVVGSGIFFKIDDIIIASGNQFLPTLSIFLIVMISVISGVLITSLYPKIDYDNKGLTNYFRLVKSPKLNYLFNSFFLLIYFPSLVVVLAISASEYFLTAFELNNSLLIIILASGLIFGSYFITNKNLNLSVLIQNSSTIIKYFALLILIVFALSYQTDVKTTRLLTTDTNFTSGIIALTFAFDGWIMIMGFTNRIKNVSRTLPLALITAVSLISFFYFTFIWAMGAIIQNEFILDDSLIYQIANLLFNAQAATLINLIIAICIFGALHATLLTYMNYIDGFKQEQLIKKPHLTSQYAILIVITYLLIQSLSYLNFVGNFDISELCIDAAYLFYLLLYYKAGQIIKITASSNYYYLILIIAIISGLCILLASLLGGGQIYFLVTIIILILSIKFKA